MAGKHTWAVRFSNGKTILLAVGILVAAGLGALFGFPAREFFPGSGPGGPFFGMLRPGNSHLMIAVLAALAFPDRRKVFVAAIFATVLAAGGPALLTLPRLGLPLACWLAASYLLLLAAGKIARDGKRVID